MPGQFPIIRDFPGKRWLNLVLRTLHVVGIVLLGVALFGTGSINVSLGLVIVSGLAMFVIDTWANSCHLRELAGIGIIVKLALLGLAAVYPAAAQVIFWAIIVLSTLLSHAPGAFRHRRLF